MRYGSAYDMENDIFVSFKPNNIWGDELIISWLGSKVIVNVEQTDRLIGSLEEIEYRYIRPAITVLKRRLTA